MSPNDLSDEELVQAGFVVGVPSEALLGPFDPRGRPCPERNGAIWEEPTGVMTTHQPGSLLLGHSRLWRPFTDWCAGVRELDDVSMQRRSSVEVEAILTLSAAKARGMFPEREADGD